jgi:hypothetical protein
MTMNTHSVAVLAPAAEDPLPLPGSPPEMPAPRPRVGDPKRIGGPVLPKRTGGSNQLIDMRELAVYIARPYQTVQKQYQKWGIPYVRVGRAICFRVRSIDAWIEAREEKPKPKP